MARRNILYVETEEPRARKPPTVETGLIKWLRDSLFSSWWNTLLTIVSVTAIIWTLIGLTRWMVQQANWAVISNNLHLFAIGTYPQDQAWRPLVATGMLLFLMGVTWRMLGRAARWLVILLGIGLALLYVLPALAVSLPNPDAYTLLGGPNQDALMGMAFIGEADQSVTFTLHPVLDFGAEDPNGFMDRTSLTVAGLARQEAVARARQVRLAVEAGATAPEDVPPGAFLTYDEESGFVITEPDLVATVTLYRAAATSETDDEGATVWTPVEPVALESLSAGPEPAEATLEVALPEAGWYILVPEYTGSTGGFWLETSGLSLLATTTAAEEQRTALYGPPPALEGTRVQSMTSANLPFRGAASWNTFVKLYLGPLSAGLANVSLVLTLATVAGYAVGALIRGQSWSRRALTIAWVVLSFVMFILLIGVTGPDGGLRIIEMERWGGLLLTMILTVVGIVVAFPFGVLLALGRRSTLPVVSTFCTVTIEFVRGVPLVTVLFAASILVPLVDPALSSVDNVLRAMVGIVFFSAAYLAEIVRGGLQAVPTGQTEAAKALGMPAWQITLLIVLPQALRAVIPAIMGQFVSLFKDTSLVLIIGLLDLLGISRSVINQAEYIGLQRETLIFISVIYFILSYLMSWASRRLEATGSGAVRRG